jgi:hypothetical protein
MPSAPPEPAAPDLDTGALEKKLGCASSGPKHAAPVVPSGEGRWVGEARAVDKGKEKTELLILGADTVPTSTVGPLDLPVRVGIGSFPDDQAGQATKLVAALSRGDVAPKSNRAATFLRTWRSGSVRNAAITSGVSVRLVSDDGVYLRQMPGQKVLLVQLKATSAGKGADGLYAELWPASW